MALYHTRLLRIIGLAAASLTCAASAQAQQDALLANIMGNPNHQAQLVARAKEAAVVKGKPCEADAFTVTNLVMVLRPPALADDKKLAAGTWIQRILRKGCGREDKLNILNIAKDGAIHQLTLLPGDTHADPVLQRDALQYAMLASIAKERDCKQAYISDTQFLAYKNEATPSGKSPPWDERWTLEKCSVTAKVLMHFIPDATGTTISTQGTETVFE